MDNPRLTLLISSCDKYSDVWDTFFSVLKLNWPDCPYKIILNTETKEYFFDGFNITCFCVCKNKTPEQLKNYEWSNRLKENLSKIDTKYTLFLLEDFYIENKVDTLKVEKLLDDFDKIKNFGAFYLMNSLENAPLYYDKKTDMYRQHHYGIINYKVKATAAIWNTKFLYKLVKNGENPWNFEMLATQRAYYYSNKFFAQQKSPIDDNIPKPKRKSGTSNRDIIFNIDYEKQIYQGKWTKKSVEYLKSLNLDIDFDKRGIADYHISEEGKQKVLTHLLKWHAGNEFLYGIKYFFNYYFVRAPKKLFRKIFKK